MKKIAVICRNLGGLSGLPNIVFAQAQMLADRGFKVDLISERIDRSRYDRKKINFVRVLRLPSSKSRRLHRFSERANKLTESKYDFVVGHGHNTVQDVLCLHTCAHLFYERIPEKPEVPGPDAFFQDAIFSRQAFKFCIVNSKLMHDEVVQRYKVDSEKLKIVYPGYDAARFNVEMRETYRETIRSQWGITQDQFVVGLATSGAFQLRGVDIAIDAFSVLPKDIRDNSRLVIIGKNSNVDFYRAQAAALGLADQVIFHGPTRKIESCYHGLDVLVHPARLETFGMVVQEAMACGIPVITNRQVGAAELLPEDVYAQLPENPSADSLAARLEQMITDNEYYKRWVEYSRLAAASNSIEINFEKNLAVYHQAGL